MLVVLRRAAAVVVLAVALAPPGEAGAQSSFAQLAGLDGCIAQMLPDSETGGRCADGNGLMQAEAVAVSPDQANVYVAASGTARSGSNAVVTSDGQPHHRAVLHRPAFPDRRPELPRLGMGDEHALVKAVRG